MNEELKPYQAKSHLQHGHTVGRKYSPTKGRCWKDALEQAKSDLGIN